jgi:pilus assembly protein CpaF
MIIQKPRRVGATLEELVRSGTISRAIATFLSQCVATRCNVLVVGPRDPGTSAIIGALASAGNDARLVLLSELDDVAPNDELATRLYPTGDHAETARALRVAARVPGARLVVEIGSPEVGAAIADSVADGSTGVIATVHAASARRALSRLSGDVGNAHGDHSGASAREWIAGTFDVVVEVGRLRDTRLRVLRVLEVGGVVDDEIRLQEIFAFAAERTAAGGAVEGSFNPSGNTPRIAEELATRGFALDTSIFTRPPSR